MVFGVFYGFNRFVEDWFRIDVTHGLGLTGSQWTALLVMVVCGAWLLFVHRTPGWGRWNERVVDGSTMQVPVETEE
jgi:prolipoprotein diacylglyceryltransferase